MQKRKQFSDFAVKDIGLDGDKISIANILNKKIYLLAYRIMRSKAVHGKQCLQLQYELCTDADDADDNNNDDGKCYISFTNSEVLMRQIQEYENELPFETTIIKRSSYYTFS